MYIDRISIKNFKAISDCQIDFVSGLNVLTGDNGAGKTSILEAVALALGGFLAGIKGVGSKGIIQEDIHMSIKPMGTASAAIEYATPVEIECRANLNDKPYMWKRVRNDETGNSRTRLENRAIEKFAQGLANDPKAVLPLISFQTAARSWQTKRGDFGNAAKAYLNDRRCGYIGCLDYSMDVKSIRQWCLEMEVAAYQKNQEISEYEAFKGIASVFMQKMNSLDKAPSIYYSRSLSEIVYRENGKDMPVSYLSAGYQSLLWMIMDLAYRMALLNPNENDLRQLPGIVLIDELDMHLHPKWQWNIVDAIKETFPNVQFITATHSPIVIASCKHVNLIQLQEDQKVTYLPGAYGFDVQDVLEFRQGSLGIARELRGLADKFDEQLNCENYEAARETFRIMQEKYGEDNTEVKKASAELELF